jgi:hypothetical protein
MMMVGWSHGAFAAPPPLTVVGNKFVDPAGRTVILRGVASMGMGMVYGDKANPGTYVPMTPAQYVDRAIQTDATGAKWVANAIRLNFERFPSTNPARLYQTENAPYAMPDTITFSPWQPATAYSDGDVKTSAGKRFRGVRKSWRADKGAAWNLPGYQIGDVATGLLESASNVYRVTAVTMEAGVGGQHWDRYPKGTTTYHEEQDGWSIDWQYVGVWGTSGTVSPDQLSPVLDNGQGFLVDGTMQWTYMSADYSPAQALANFTDWKTKVMDPVVQRAIDDGLYVVICEFDFGPAQHPLRHARMADFWHRMATSQWKNHPQVLFELFNESEDIGSFPGGAGSWAVQKPVLQEVVNMIRADGATNIILVPTPFYSSWIGEATSSPLVGPNLAYTLHQYRSQWEAYSSNRDQILQGLASGQAIVMTEWGDDTSETNPLLMWPNATTALPPLRQLLEPSDGSVHPAAGWFAWALTQTWYPDLYSDSALTIPTPFGIATRQWLFDKRNDSQPLQPPAAPTNLRIR